MGLAEGLGEWRQGRDSGRWESEQEGAVGNLYEENLMGRSRVEESWVTLRVMHWDLIVCSGGGYLTIDLAASNAIHRGHVMWDIWNTCQCTVPVAFAKLTLTDGVVVVLWLDPAVSVIFFFSPGERNNRGQCWLRIRISDLGSGHSRLLPLDWMLPCLK